MSNAETLTQIAINMIDACTQLLGVSETLLMSVDHNNSDGNICKMLIKTTARIADMLLKNAEIVAIDDEEIV